VIILHKLKIEKAWLLYNVMATRKTGEYPKSDNFIVKYSEKTDKFEANAYQISTTIFTSKDYD
jgi:hypothetical protein